MLNLPSTPWLWTPLIAAVLVSVLACLFAYSEKATKAAPRIIARSFFEGPALTNSGAISTVLSMIPLLLSQDVRADPASASLLGAATLLFAITTFLGFWLYSAVAAAKRVEPDLVSLPSNRLIAVQGVVIYCMIVAAACFVAFILVTPLLKSVPGPEPKLPATFLLECSDAGCKPRR